MIMFENVSSVGKIALLTVAAFKIAKGHLIIIIYLFILNVKEGLNPLEPEGYVLLY